LGSTRVRTLPTLTAVCCFGPITVRARRLCVLAGARCACAAVWRFACWVVSGAPCTV
jgi:hypothetical protein